MKRIIFFVLVAIAVGSIYWFINYRGFKSLEGEVVQSKFWDEILVGTWEYDFQSQGGEHYIIGKGEITFNANKSYTFYKTDNYYWGKPHTNNALIVVGGSVLGTWETEDEHINFAVNQCNLKVSEDKYGELSNPCETTLLKIGNFSATNGIGKFHTFSSETVIFKFKNYNDNSVDEITLRKKTND